MKHFLNTPFAGTVHRSLEKEGRFSTFFPRLTMVLFTVFLIALPLVSFSEARGILGRTRDDLVKIQPTSSSLRPFLLDMFGANVAVDANTLVVGAPASRTRGLFAGAAYVFVFENGEWKQQAEYVILRCLCPFFVPLFSFSSDFLRFHLKPFSFYFFCRLIPEGEDNRNTAIGWHVAISGDTAVVGSMTNSEAARHGGAVYVFVRTGTEWTQQQKLLSPDPVEKQYFGLKVAVEGDTLLAGAQYTDAQDIKESGSVYVFVRNGEVWSLQEQLFAGDGIEGQKFGSSLALEGDTIVVGAPSGRADRGSAYVFQRSGIDWTQVANIVPEDRQRGWFGDSIAVSGSTIAVGDWTDSFTQGSVSVYTGSASTWNLEQKIVAEPRRMPLEMFSFNIALEGDTLVVGGMFGGSFKGETYIYKRTGTSWAREETIRGNRLFSAFGDSVSIDSTNGNIAIGAMMEGAAYVYSPSTA
jgi:hypothetical protein